MDVIVNYIVIILLTWMVVQFCSSFIKFKKKDFSNPQNYYCFLMSRIILIILFGILIGSFLYDFQLSEYMIFLWLVALYMSTYYITDLANQGKMPSIFSVTLLRVLRIMIVILIIIFTFAAIRATI